MFIELEETEHWYVVALDGLRHLESVIQSPKNAKVSAATLATIKGMSIAEWQTFLGQREAEHETFASLAALAAFEGLIRRDAAWRGRANEGQAHHLRFRRIAANTHVPISKLFEAWERALRREAGMSAQFRKLRDLYSQRNVLAHGAARRGEFFFDGTLKTLSEAQRKWRGHVRDFGLHA